MSTPIAEVPAPDVDTVEDDAELSETVLDDVIGGIAVAWLEDAE